MRIDQGSGGNYMGIAEVNGCGISESGKNSTNSLVVAENIDDEIVSRCRRSSTALLSRKR